MVTQDHSIVYGSLCCLVNMFMNVYIVIMKALWSSHKNCIQLFMSYLSECSQVFIFMNAFYRQSEYIFSIYRVIYSISSAIPSVVIMIYSVVFFLTNAFLLFEGMLMYIYSSQFTTLSNKAWQDILNYFTVVFVFIILFCKRFVYLPGLTSVKCVRGCFLSAFLWYCSEVL